jgi:hypothetical protein
MTPLGAVIRGALAGAAGTLAMDLVQYARYRSKGGESPFPAWESSEGLDDWEAAPAPAHVGRRLVEGLFQQPLPPEAARLTNNVTHWGYGLAWGAAFGVVEGSLRRSRFRHGLAFGFLVWSSGYLVLPAAKLYKPVWEYDIRTLAEDLGGHLVFGSATAVTFRVLGGRRA